MNNGKIHESTQPVGYILCKKDNCYILYKKDNSIMLENIIIKDLGNSINLLNESMTFNNQHLFPSNIYVTGNLAAFLVILLGKEH